MSSSPSVTSKLRLPSFHNVLRLSTFLRVALILYSEWHDRHSLVKYTDVDYRVFSDAARFILHPGPGETNHAQGPLVSFLQTHFNISLNLGDPYTRETYRYTPLLALLLTPNDWLHPSFGKYFFAACDIINGVLIYRLLVSEILPSASSAPSKSKPKDESATSDTVSETLTAERIQGQATLYTSLHLLNPLVFSISTRGSSESVLALFVLLTLYSVLKARWDAAAILLGLSTHWKIYPVVYGVACLGVIGSSCTKIEEEKGWKGYVRTLINWRTLRFGVISAGTFVLLGAGCYLIWGYPFLHESYLYHIHRLDHRHNFSPYFYLTYLTYPPLVPPSHPVPLSAWSKLVRSPLVSFGPQMVLALGTGLVFGRRRRDVVFAWFVQTVVFVLFNKVCTSQYFLWYLLLLPLLLPRLSTSPLRGLLYLGVWVGTQALWLAEAYKLEFLGRNVFFGLWVRSLVYVLGNVWVLAGIMGDYVV
ncbi:GPI mannosyltransferase 1 [Hypsizygus marmoreus]|uniref:GPI mannosyltransferase 1 n=1 Tax=Hypsizygus marmoreus TaxID=39966 RepID=A0A369JNX4_HYPMA|nr:GPI mannosyltransferase 1 [Hypsizygus marmoreus]